MTNQDLCKITDSTLKMTDLLMTPNHTSLQQLIFLEVFNKTLTASDVSRDSEARQVSQPVRAWRAQSRGPVQTNHTVLNQFLHCLEAIQDLALNGFSPLKNRLVILQSMGSVILNWSYDIPSSNVPGSIQTSKCCFKAKPSLRQARELHYKYG